MSNCLDKVEMVADLKKELHSVVNRDKKWILNFNASNIFFFVSMADVNVQESNSLWLLGLKFSADMREKHYYDSTELVTPQNIVSLWSAVVRIYRRHL